MTKRHLVVVGDVLLDRDLEGRAERLCPDAPAPVVDDPAESVRAGGAGLAATLAAERGDLDVTLVTAIARDSSGERVRDLLASAGVTVVDLGLDGRTPEKVRIRAGGRSLVRVDVAAHDLGAVGGPTSDAADCLERADAVLVSDYGRGVAAARGVRTLLAAADTPIVWDPHPRGPAPVAGSLLVTPNSAESVRAVPDVEGNSIAAVTARAHRLVRLWRARGVVVTIGERGAVLVEEDGGPLAVPAPPAPGPVDPCGAGDCFAATAAALVANGSVTSEAVTGAVAAASSFVANASPAPGQQHTGESAAAVVARVRAAGRTVVAAGGCFDMLHAGHVSLLAAARSLGDCLIVCVNSDASVRRLKGPGRPAVSAEDRAAVLQALRSVDAVAVFDEDTPEVLLSRLRPDVFVKGADYSAAQLPEARLLASWGGQAVTVPYLDGRSTTGILEVIGRD